MKFSGFLSSTCWVCTHGALREKTALANHSETWVKPAMLLLISEESLHRHIVFFTHYGLLFLAKPCFRLPPTNDKGLIFLLLFQINLILAFSSQFFGEKFSSFTGFNSTFACSENEKRRKLKDDIIINISDNLFSFKLFDRQSSIIFT